MIFKASGFYLRAIPRNSTQFCALRAQFLTISRNRILIGDPDPRSNKKAYFDLIDISESAFSLHNKVFMDNLRSIILYAVFGTICNFLMIGEYMGGHFMQSYELSVTSS